MSDATMSERVRLVGVLDAHGRDGRKSYVAVVCVCGWRGASLEHHAHIADALLAAGFGSVAQMKAERDTALAKVANAKYEALTEAAAIADEYAQLDMSDAVAARLVDRAEEYCTAK